MIRDDPASWREHPVLRRADEPPYPDARHAQPAPAVVGVEEPRNLEHQPTPGLERSYKVAPDPRVAVLAVQTRHASAVGDALPEDRRARMPVPVLRPLQSSSTAKVKPAMLQRANKGRCPRPRGDPRRTRPLPRKLACVTPRLAARPAGRWPSCRVPAGLGIPGPAPFSEPISNAPATTSAPSDELDRKDLDRAWIHPGCTTSSASQNAIRSPRAICTPMLRAAAGPRRAEASTRRIALQRSAQERTVAALASVEPLSATTTSQSDEHSCDANARELLIQPREAVEHGHHDADHPIDVDTLGEALVTDCQR